MVFVDEPARLRRAERRARALDAARALLPLRALPLSLGVAHALYGPPASAPRRPPGRCGAARCVRPTRRWRDQVLPLVAKPTATRSPRSPQILMALILMNVGMAVLLEEFGAASQRFRDQASARGGALRVIQRSDRIAGRPGAYSPAGLPFPAACPPASRFAPIRDPSQRVLLHPGFFSQRVLLRGTGVCLCASPVRQRSADRVR